MMKLASIVFVVFVAFVVYVTAQGTASNEYWKRFKRLRQRIWSAGQTKDIPSKIMSWEERRSCLPDDLSLVPQRLLDWFHVLKSINERKSNNRVYDKKINENIKENGCSSPALTWFFKEFDTNKDMVLNEHELNEIESIPYEHCLKQFFQLCDSNKDGQLSLKETCRCFTVDPPCFDALKRYKHRFGEYKPQCDEDGFFKPRQCHERYCWCVDRFNQVIEGTHVEGLADCPDNTDPDEKVFTGGEEEEKEHFD